MSDDLCIQTYCEINQALECDPLSDSDRLRFLQGIRDKLWLAVAQGEAITYLEVRNRRVQMSDPVKVLQLIVKAIKDLVDAVTGASAGRSNRNRVMLRGF